MNNNNNKINIIINKIKKDFTETKGTLEVDKEKQSAN